MKMRKKSQTYDYQRQRVGWAELEDGGQSVQAFS